MRAHDMLSWASSDILFLIYYDRCWYIIVAVKTKGIGTNTRARECSRGREAIIIIIIIIINVLLLILNYYYYY